MSTIDCQDIQHSTFSIEQFNQNEFHVYDGEIVVSKIKYSFYDNVEIKASVKLMNEWMWWCDVFFLCVVCEGGIGRE